MNQKRNIEEFWSWFRRIAVTLAADVENRSLIQELDARVRELDLRLSWEIGPGAIEPWQLVISPNMDHGLRPKAQQIISQAPVIQGWEFHSARRPKNWDYKLLMERSDGRPSVHLDAADWEFVLLRYPDGCHEVLLQGSNISSLDDDERWHAAAIILENILGEEILLDKIDQFELVDQIEPRFAGKQKPIQQLRETILAE